MVKKGKAKGALRVVTGKAKCKKKTEKTLNWNQKGVAGAAGAAGLDAVAPANAVMFFAQASCPAGWTEYAPAQGRYLVGLPPGGTLERTDGTALSDGEDRPTGQHTHTINDPGHTHSADVDPILVGGNVTARRFQATADTQGGTSLQSLSTNLAFTGITINPSGSVPGTNAPYVQLLACKKT